ncbi:hypothetical protein ABZ442_15010 [Streptomyces triculaminicus]|uniref:hypothetical protein n=1 Tax=Streptomyces triculaminicus TaxID=2816232 RepID=UPI0033C2DF33
MRRLALTVLGTSALLGALAAPAHADDGASQGSGGTVGQVLTVANTQLENVETVAGTQLENVETVVSQAGAKL